MDSGLQFLVWFPKDQNCQHNIFLYKLNARVHERGKTDAFFNTFTLLVVAVGGVEWCRVVFKMAYPNGVMQTIPIYSYPEVGLSQWNHVDYSYAKFTCPEVGLSRWTHENAQKKQIGRLIKRQFSCCLQVRLSIFLSYSSNKTKNKQCSQLPKHVFGIPINTVQNICQRKYYLFCLWLYFDRWSVLRCQSRQKSQNGLWLHTRAIRIP